MFFPECCYSVFFLFKYLYASMYFPGSYSNNNKHAYSFCYDKATIKINKYTYT